MKELLKSRKKIGITIGVGIIIFLALYLIGGGKQTKNEKEIMEDLNSDTSWFQYCELKVDNLTIEKRKTDKKTNKNRRGESVRDCGYCKRRDTYLSVKCN